MEALTIFSTLLSLGACSVIKHDFNLEIGDKKAGSYQSVHIEHFHPEPTYIKKEKGDKGNIDHPLPAGKTVSNVEIHHGDKHNPGYAIQSSSDDSHIFKADDDGSPSELADFENSHDDHPEDDDVGGGYQVQEDYHQQQPYYPQDQGQQSYYPQEQSEQPYYPQEHAHQHHYDYIPKEHTEQHPGLSHYYSYPHPQESQTNFRYQPIVVAEQEKS